MDAEHEDALNLSADDLSRMVEEGEPVDVAATDPRASASNSKKMSSPYTFTGITHRHDCTCGVYHSVTPPGPCPVHSPQRCCGLYTCHCNHHACGTFTVITTSNLTAS